MACMPFRARLRQFFGRTCALQKTESGSRVKFDVGIHRISPPHKPFLPDAIVIKTIKSVSRSSHTDSLISHGSEIQTQFHIPFVLCHASSRHQSPEVRHGPEAAMTSPRIPRNIMFAGHDSRSCTFAGNSGRTFRNQSPAVDLRFTIFFGNDFADLLPPHRAFFGGTSWALPTPEQIGPYGIRPAGASPPIPASRYSRRRPSSPAAPPSIPVFPRSGEAGRNNPLCTARGGAGSAVKNFQNGWALPADRPAIATAAISKAFWNPAWARANSKLFHKSWTTFSAGFFVPNLQFFSHKNLQIKSHMNCRRSQ